MLVWKIGNPRRLWCQKKRWKLPGAQGVEEKSAAIVKVDKSKRPVYLDPQGKSEFYIRAGNSSQPLNVREATAYIQDHWPSL
jgi:hypothetical protein